MIAVDGNGHELKVPGMETKAKGAWKTVKSQAVRDERGSDATLILRCLNNARFCERKRPETGTGMASSQHWDAGSGSERCTGARLNEALTKTARTQRAWPSEIREAQTVLGCNAAEGAARTDLMGTVWGDCTLSSRLCWRNSQDLGAWQSELTEKRRCDGRRRRACDAISGGETALRAPESVGTVYCRRLGQVFVILQRMQGIVLDDGGRSVSPNAIKT